MSGSSRHSIELQPGETPLNGVLERIVFFNEENHFCIGEFRPEERRDTVTVTGNLPGVQCGETLELAGNWTNNPRYGDQFKIRTYRATLPSSVHGIRKYLGSGLVPGIGKVYANKIVDHFGTETLRVISEESARLREVPGIGKQRVQSIKRSWDEQQALREVMVFLQTYGVSVGQCLRLVKKYGNAAKTVLVEEPYRVAREVPGIGFKTADRIAINIGFANDSPQRIDAGILYALQALEDEGHTGFPLDELQIHAAELLAASLDLAGTRMRELVKNHSIVLSPHGDLAQLPENDRAESEIAKSVSRILSAPGGLPPIKTEAAVRWAQERSGFGYAPEQISAVRAALLAKISIITGGPGTGKTTILRAVVDILNAKKVRLKLASPTGRAAQRMAEATGRQAQTIHRMLKYDPAEGRFTVNDDSPLKADVLIVDETSMLDCQLAASLFRAIPARAHLVLVGDVNQLPSVGAGNVLMDLIDGRRIPVTRLTKIFRQEAESSIVHIAHRILGGNPTPPPTVEATEPGDLTRGDDIRFVKAVTPEDCLATVIDVCRRVIPASSPGDPLMDAQVLAPMHKGVVGITRLNRELQAALNPGAPGIQVGETRFLVGDKVIQTRNNYDKNIFNGDFGRIVAIDKGGSGITAEFDGRRVEFERIELYDLKLAYATSIHKSQGSEFPIVVVPVLKQHFIMLQRNLLYTAVTRGRRHVYVIGDPAAWAMAVRNSESAVRRTGLLGRIQSLVPPRDMP